MKPKKLTICGWGPYKSKEEVDFTAFEEKGVFLITGATGSGKTTIFDAISYALYGALTGEERDKERSSTRSDFADGDTPTYVELMMEHDGALYHIRRNPEYLRPKKRNSGMAAFTKEKENAILTYPDGRVLEGVREVNAALKDILVLDYQQFKKISMIAQGEFARLLVAPPKEKTKIFREIFGTGVFERFTQELGVRARAAYAKVSEQKHKLEEDIRHLTVGLEKSGWSEELRADFKALTDAENWNYEAICDCLEKMIQESGEHAKVVQRAFEKADKGVEKLTAMLVALEEENKKVKRLQQAEEELAVLQGKELVFREKQKQLQATMNAGWVEACEEKLQLAKSQLARKEVQAEQLVKRHAEAIGQLEVKQQAYLQQEHNCVSAKEAYEAAEHMRRLDAIGLAVELLEEGKPCPVCGSIEHPAPAKGSDEMLPQEMLKALKEKLAEEENRLNAIHREAVSLKTKADAFMEQIEQLRVEINQAESGVVDAEKAFADTLKQYGFEDVQAYIDAKMSKADREALQQELEHYSMRKAAAEELCKHLSDTVESRELHDLSKIQLALSEEKIQKDEALRKQRLWENHNSEVKKIRKLVAEKLEKIACESEEYGYVKDLENLAVGNNSKRLVFEQYVLAGYFEEILRAANLRFAKMTGGRYEMSRLQEVGDGRVKDNLEIQVLDYYTGKYRSVRTLSGGESFKASLSLALGMSDVIQAMNGGIRVDTLFVDEGFGSLDDESLEQACSTLMSLAEKKHLIGIISHVQELRERIDNQLVIKKTGNGSKIHAKV